jgi:selenoprotein W-related protein
MLEMGVESTMTPGGGGVFDVVVDGKTVFSKKAIGRFPEPGEVVSMLQKR